MDRTDRTLVAFSQDRFAGWVAVPPVRAGGRGACLRGEEDAVSGLFEGHWLIVAAAVLITGERWCSGEDRGYRDAPNTPRSTDPPRSSGFREDQGTLRHRQPRRPSVPARACAPACRHPLTLCRRLARRIPPQKPYPPR